MSGTPTVLKTSLESRVQPKARRGREFAARLFHIRTSMLANLILFQRKISYWLDRKCLPVEYSLDGNACFDAEFVSQFLRSGHTVVDLGGGKHPVISPDRKSAFGVRVIGFDVSQRELESAPPGSYDSMICADVTKFTGDGSADLVICSALLEHVKDVAGAIRCIASMLKPSGAALLFVPSRNSLAARINLLLPEGFKRRLLSWLFPEMRSAVGFPAYYDRCTPRQITSLALQNGMVPEKTRLYFSSGYFTVLVPAHIFWRIFQGAQRLLIGGEAAESFSVALRKSSVT
jgi:2-polyprenyl-3-methyl-5-hydroxy-6-metoxy-1,4-benzoquinol methylase